MGTGAWYVGMPRVGQEIEQPKTNEQRLRDALRALLRRLDLLPPYSAVERDDDQLVWLAEYGTLHLFDKIGIVPGGYEADIPF